MIAREQTVVLVSCVGRKLDHPAEARDLYQSAWFKKARAYAENFGDRWYILSALHGLVEPTSTIDPYDRRLPSTEAGRLIWARAAAAQIRRVTDPLYSTLVVLAGVRYRDPLLEYLADYPIDVPMAGLGIGQQLQWLDHWEVPS